MNTRTISHKRDMEKITIFVIHIVTVILLAWWIDSKIDHVAFRESEMIQWYYDAHFFARLGVSTIYIFVVTAFVFLWRTIIKYLVSSIFYKIYR
jgi:hypothetical protein